MNIIEPMGVAVRSYFSTHHLWAARHFCRLAADIENKHTEKPRFNLEHRAYVNNSVLSSVAFLEAAINEIFQDSYDDHQNYIGILDKEVIDHLASHWKETEIANKYESILRKYNSALRIAMKKEFDLGRDPYKNADLVIKLRNFLTHYKPRRIGEDITHELQTKLKGKFDLNKIYVKSGNADFPDKMLSCGCAEWAIVSTKKLADEFFNRLEVEPNYQKVDMVKLEGMT